MEKSVIKIIKKNEFYELVLFISSNKIKQTVSEDFLLRNKLLIPRDITDKEFNEILLEDFYVKQVRLLKKKLKTEYEVYYNLSKKLKEKEINYIIGNLKVNGYINDDLYQKLYINDAINKLKGPFLIKHELMKKGIKNINLDLYTKELIEENKNIIKEKYPDEYKKYLYKLGYFDPNDFYID